MKKFPYYSALVTAALVAATTGNAWSEQTTANEPATQVQVPANSPVQGWYPPRHTPGGYPQPWQHAPRWPAPPPGYGQIPPQHPRQGQHPAASAPPAMAATAPAENTELQQLRNRLTECLATEQALTDKLALSTREQQALQARMAELTAELDATSTSREVLRQQLMTEREQFQSSIAAQGKQQTALQQAQADASAAGAARDAAMAESDTLRNELDKLRTAQESKTAGLLEDMQAQAADYTRLQTELAARDAQLATLQAELQVAAKALQQAQADSAAAGAAHDAATAKINTLRNELDNLMAAQENKAHGMLQEIEEQAADHNRLQTELAARDAQLATLQAELQVATEALQQAQSDAAAASATRDAAMVEADMLRTGLGKLRAVQESKTAGLLQDMQAQAADHNRLQTELAACDTQQANLQAELRAARLALQKSQADTGTTTAALSKASARVEFLDGELAKLRSEMDSWKTTLVDTGQSLADLKLVRNGLQSDLDDCKLALQQSQPALPTAGPAAGLPAQAPLAAVVPGTADTVVEPASAAAGSRAPQGANTDSDGDRITDSNDLCPGTQPGLEVDSTGCAAGAAIALEGVNFPYDSHELTADARTYLDRIAGVISQHPDLRLQVAGHTDATGDPAYNQWLSMQRAEAVMRYLVAQGVNPGHIGAVGYGGQRPIADNDTLDGLRKNRRVELRRLQ